MTNKYTLVTTFNADGYALYGQRMIQTFLKNWPDTVNLKVYAEGVAVKETAKNLEVLDFEQVSPELISFKTQWKNIPKANGDVSADPIRSKRKDSGKGFKWNAIRFAHKVYAIFHAAKYCNTQWLIWVDADMVCHSPITEQNLEKLCQGELCFLGRRGKYSECGLYAMNLQQPRIREFLCKFQDFYDNAETGIFTLAEWHDSFVFDHIRTLVPGLQELDWSSHLIKGEGHPLINSEWGAYLDHLKGQRKDTGHSLKKDLLVKRSEEYWSRHT